MMNHPFRGDKRKQFLTVGGIGYAAIGFSYVVESTPGRRAAFEWLPLAWTPNGLGWVWVMGGLASVVIALGFSRFRYAQSVAFTLLAICPAAWASVFIGATITHTYPPGWVSSILYVVLMTWTLIAAGWDNPRDESAEAQPLPVIDPPDEGEEAIE